MPVHVLIGLGKTRIVFKVVVSPRLCIGVIGESAKHQVLQPARYSEKKKLDRKVFEQYSLADSFGI